MTAATTGGAPLTDKERAQWTLHRLAAGRPVCNLGVAVRVRRPLRWWPLQAALDHLARRHAPLRSTVTWAGSAPRRHTAAAAAATVPLRVVSATDDDLATVLNGLVREPFDLDGGEPLIRAHLAFPGPDSVVMLTAHHLVADATSIAVLVPELLRLYAAYATEQPVPDDLAAPVDPFTEPPPDDAALRYWIDHLEGLEPTALARARPVPPRPTFAGDRIEYQLPGPVRLAVSDLRRRTRATDNVVLLAAFYLLLAAHGAGPDLAVGVPVNGRRGETGRNAVGYHVNTLPMRLRVDRDESMDGLVARVREVFVRGLEHGSVSFEDIQARRGIRAVDWRVPVFRHSLNFHPVIGDRADLLGEPVELLHPDAGTSRLDLELNVRLHADVGYLTAVYSTEVHGRAEIVSLLDRYVALLTAVAAAPDRPVGDLDLLSPADRDLLRASVGPVRTWPAGTVLDGFVDRVARGPDAVAVHHRAGSVTYRRLAGDAARVRRAVEVAGVAPGDVVAVHAARGPALAAAVLGVWAAGAAYLPLDPGHPAARSARQLDDAGVRLVLTDRPVPAAGDRNAIRIDELSADGPDPEFAPSVDPAAVAYVIYTSGSTGRPKGVAVTHANVNNLVRHFAGHLGAGPSDRTLWLTTFSFDISALELLVPLVTGGGVVVAPDELRPHPVDLLDLVASTDVTILQATPTTWRMLAPHLRGHLRGRRVLCGGEPMSRALADALLADGCRLFNVYGPTETTIWSTAAELSTSTGPEPGPPSIGRPITNTTVSVRDERGRPVLPGLPGELCVGGAGVAVGYRRDGAATAERFVDDPRDGRYYRTGDLVRHRGPELEFLGRTDRQIKIRGMRVEPGEVEAVLEEHPGVRTAVVLVRPDADGQPTLAAAVRPATDPPDVDDLRRFVAARLPSQAVPVWFAIVDAVPLTGNGKIDHTALASLLDSTRPADPPPDGTSGPLPADPVVGTLVTLWREVLDDAALTEETNFFLAGGHSVLAARLAERINMELGTRLGLDDIFAAPTPVDLAESVAGSVSRVGTAAGLR